jgi:subtilisin family serine protease
MYKTLPAGLMVLGVALIGYNLTTHKASTRGKANSYHRPAAVEDQAHAPFFAEKLNPSTKKSEKTSVLMNDPDINKNWGLKVSEALKAHGITQGSKNVVVAIVDTGIDVYHKDLKNNLWVNPGESGTDTQGRDKATNGIDDDQNGYADDVHGWNFVTNSNKLDDNHGHGTHIAGIVGAEGNNNFGITGIASKVSMMVLKYYDPKMPSNNLENTIKAFDYATKMNANIINYSGGGLEYSQPEFEAIRRARSKGVLFVAAAGNERSNSDKQKYYPANYDLDNIISVTAIDPKLQVLASSNYGVQTVHIAAPGEDIYSTWPGGTFGSLTGTSQATAFATGLAVLIKANNPEFNYLAIKNYILKTGDDYPWLRSKTGTSKKLNMYKALTSLDQGVGASGVLATNMNGASENAFSSDPQASISTPANDMVEFGKGLMKSMGNETPSVRNINNN